MATRERPADVGRRRGEELSSRLRREIRIARIARNLSCRAVAESIGWSQSAYRRFENGFVSLSVPDAAVAAAVLGLELGLKVYPVSDSIRDKGHQALIRRLRKLLSNAWAVTADAPFPRIGDRRAWDLLLQIPAQLVGVEAETQIRDMQQLVRHVHMRERDGGTGIVLVVLSDSRLNRLLVDEFREALGSRYRTSPAVIVRALKAGQALPGSGVVLL